MSFLFLSLIISSSAFAQSPTLQSPRQLAEQIASQFSSVQSVDQLLLQSSLEDVAKSSARAKIGPVQMKKKLTFESSGDSVVAKSEKGRSVIIKLVNPLVERYLVNGYEVSLAGKSPSDKFAYLQKVIRANPANLKKSARHLLTFFFSQAGAADLTAWLSDEELATLGLAATEVTGAAKQSTCKEFKSHHDRKNSIRPNLSMTGQTLAFSESSSKVGVAFWCGNLKNHAGRPLSGFSVKCAKDTVESMAYVSGDNVGANVGYINKTKKTFGSTDASEFVEKKFGSDFAKSLEKCCSNKRCADEINQLAPIPKTRESEALENHNSIQRKTGSSN